MGGKYLHKTCYATGRQAVPSLSAPAGYSINDFIFSEDFSLHYTSVDDAVRLLFTLGTGVQMAKVDLKATFRMIPVRKQDALSFTTYFVFGYHSYARAVKVLDRSVSKGARTRPAAHSLASSLSIICGCIDADGRFLAFWGPRGFVYPMSTLS